MRLLIVGICCLLTALSSCADKQEEWLQIYAQTKCAYQTEEDRINVDSIAQIPSLITEKVKLQEQLLVITAPFDKKIEELNEEIKEAQREYMKSYRKAEEAQNAKFGHQNTPAYEKEISLLDNIKTTKIKSLQNKITIVKSEMENNSNYKSLTEKIKIQDEKIKLTQETITKNHRVVIDSLQELLNVQNSNFKHLKRELEPKEQKMLELKRDSIRINPCK